MFVGLLLLLVLAACGGGGDESAVSIKDAVINEDNELVFELSDGNTINVGVVIGEKGDKGDKGDTGAPGSQGVGIKTIEIDNDGMLIITLTDDTEIECGLVVGKDGKDGKDGVAGKDGKDGKDGIGIKNMEINDDGELVVTYSDDTTKNLGPVVGKDGNDGKDGVDGKDGQPGKDGVDGKDGKDGVDGLSTYQLYLKHYPGYPGTEKEWLTELVSGKLMLDVEFELFDGKLPEDYEVPEFIMKGDAYEPAPLEREGYEFEGWFLDDKFTKPYDPEMPVLENLKLFACWSLKGSFKTTGRVGTHTIEDVQYLFQEFELFVEEEKISLHKDNVISITSNGKALTPNTDHTLWFSVLKEPGDYEFRVVGANHILYKATLEWKEPTELEAVETGDPAYNEDREETYQLYVVDLDTDPDNIMYQIKPDGSITKLTILEDDDNKLNLWFRLSSPTNPQLEGLHRFLILKDEKWYEVRISYGVVEAKWNATGRVGTNTINDIQYLFQEFELLVGNKKLSLHKDDVVSIKVDGKELTPNTDDTLWFNVLKETGKYEFEIIDKDYVKYKAVLEWTEPVEVEAVKTGSPQYNEDRKQTYQLYVVDIDVTTEDIVYQIKPDGSITELTVLEDVDEVFNIWFRMGTLEDFQQVGEHKFLILHGGVWSIATIEYATYEGTWKATGRAGFNTIDGTPYLFQEFELIVDGKKVSLHEDDIVAIKCNGKDLVANTDSTLWFNVLNESRQYEFLILDKDYNIIEAVLDWTYPEDVDAVKTGDPTYDEESDETYQLYVVDIDVTTTDKVFQIMPDGTISEFTVPDDTDEINIWFRLSSLTNFQQEGEHMFLILHDGKLSMAVIEYKINRADLLASDVIIEDDEYYIVYDLMFNDVKFNLHKDNIKGVLINGEEIELKDDNRLLVNLFNDDTDYEFAVIDKDHNLYVASLKWRKGETMEATLYGSPKYFDETDSVHQLYTYDHDSFRGFVITPDGNVYDAFILEEDHYGVWFPISNLDGIYKVILFGDEEIWRIVEIEHEEKELVYYAVDSFGNFEVLHEFENDPKRMVDHFIKDWNKKFGTTWTELKAVEFFNSAKIGVTSSTNLAGSNIYKFFNDPVYKDKWGWLLDFIKSVDGTTHPTRQIVAIQGDGTNGTYALYNADHLCYSIANFFNRSHVVGGYTAINFTGVTIYNNLPNYNNKIKVSYKHYDLVYEGEKVTIPAGPEKADYVFDYFTDGTNQYKAGDQVLFNEHKKFTPVYKAIEYSVKFYDGEEELVDLADKYTHEEAYNLPVFEKEGYIFLGWYDNPNFTGDPITTLAKGSRGDREFYAKLVVDNYSRVEVTYKLNGGVLNSTDMYKLRDSDVYIEATRYSTAGDGAGATITVGTGRGGLYWYVIALKETYVPGVYEAIGKGVGYTNAEADLYLSYHDNCTSPYKDTIKSMYNNLVIGSLFVIEWLPPSVTGDTSIDIYHLPANAATDDVTVEMVLPGPMLQPMKEGYIFEGWCTEEDLSDTPINEYPSFSKDSGVTSITYYAKWKVSE